MTTTSLSYLNMVNYIESAGTFDYILQISEQIRNGCWIVDIRASIHMCCDEGLFDELHELDSENPII